MDEDKLPQFLEFLLNELNYLLKPVPDHLDKLEKLVQFLEINVFPNLMKFSTKDAEHLESIITKIMENFKHKTFE